jgi:hypothetical protein
MRTYIFIYGPNKLAVKKHVFRPNLADLIVLERLKVILTVEELFQHDVGSTFERATPFVETLGDLIHMVSDGGRA